jgi:hypothetical protein
MLLVLGFAVLIMAALGGGAPLGLILFAATAFLAIALHYVLWGWWLGPRLREQADRQAAEETRYSEQE